MKKSFLIVLVFMLSKATGQVVNYDFYSFRMGNMFNVNPAYCTNSEGINVIVNAQSLGPGIDYSNKNLMAGIYSRIANKSGLGLKVISDSRGAFQSFKSDVSYGFIAKLSDEHTLRFGVNAGVYNSSIRINRIENYDLLDQSDPTLANGNLSNTQFVTGAGLLYSFNNLEVSASLPQIVSTTQPLNSYFHSAVFYKIPVNDDVKIQPWISYQNMPLTKNVFGTYVKGSYKDFVWAQMGYQSNKSLMTAVGVLFENVGLSYGFRLSNGDFKQVSGATHEIAISFKFGGKKASKEEGSADLSAVLVKLEDLLKKDVTADNKEQLQSELFSIKEMLRKAEIDNSNPKKVKEVEKQLVLIEEKLSILEKRLTK